MHAVNGSPYGETIKLGKQPSFTYTVRPHHENTRITTRNSALTQKRNVARNLVVTQHRFIRVRNMDEAV